MLAGHVPTQFFVFVMPSAAQVVTVAPLPGDSAGATVRASESSSGSTTSAPGASPAVSRPVQRLGQGDHFSGYDYQQVIAAEQAADAAAEAGGAPDAPPQMVPPTPPPPGQKPPKLRPSIEGNGTPPPAPAAPLPTPLALTPVALHGGVPSSARPGLAVPSPVVVGPEDASSGTAIRIAVPQSHVTQTVAAISPVAVFANIEISPAQMAGGLAYASEKASDALSFVASPAAEVGAVAYNFVHFNPATLLNDTIASFTAESATLSAAQPAQPAPARAWTITSAVIGLDLVFVGYWYQKTRRESAALRRRVRAWGLEIDPCQRRVL